MIRFAHKINSIRKLVFSGSLEKASWENSILIRSDLVEEVKKLKGQPGKNISIGGISIASELAKNGLIDEFWFVVQPMIAGTGIHLWKGLDRAMKLKFVDKRLFKSGVIVLHYVSVN
jgi:dihydrofolate reductase